MATLNSASGADGQPAMDSYSSKSGDGDGKFIRPPAFYDAWQEGEGIPIYKVYHVDDMMEVELGRWERFGCDGAFVNLADPFLTTAILVEIPPGAQTKAVRHMFETWCFVVDGRGETTVEQPGQGRGIVRWGKRSLFGPPLNTTYQHRNLDPNKPARILMVTNAPLTLNLYHNEKFVFDNPFVFEDRFDGRQGFFNEGITKIGGRVVRTNFIPDTLKFQLIQWKDRGYGAKSFHMSMSEHTMAAHLSEFDVGTYKKAHRHGPGAHVILLAGTGYSLLWKDGMEPRRVDWKENSLFAPPEWTFHQHFNTGPEPARYLALRRGGSPEHPLKIGMTGGKDAPDQIEYEEEPPWIYDMYEEELRKNGVTVGQPRPVYHNVRNTIVRPAAQKA
jgi:oxalate decarboxylase/phosphoglucose isomerase-like protein (cupin superfamily)